MMTQDCIHAAYWGSVESFAEADTVNLYIFSVRFVGFVHRCLHLDPLL